VPSRVVHWADAAISAGIEVLSRYAGSDRRAAEVFAMHHLVAPFWAARAGSRTALKHLAEAETSAQHTGEGSIRQFLFGPTNVGIWRQTILVNLGEFGAVLQPVERFAPEVISSRHRLATFWAATHQHGERSLS
jgi:hypothetical protein